MRLRALSVRRAAPGGFFVKIGCPRVVYGPLPLFPLPLSPWFRRGRAVFAIFSPVVHVVNGGDFRPKFDGRRMQLLVQGARLGPGRLPPFPHAKAREVEAASPSPLPTVGVSLPLSPCSREGMEVGGDTRGSLTFTLTMLFTLGASLPSPDPSEGGGRRQGRYRPRGGWRQRGVGSCFNGIASMA